MELSCSNCGTVNHTAPPDGERVIPKTSPCRKGDSMSVPLECNNCHTIKTIHWDKKHDENEDRFNRISNVYP